MIRNVLALALALSAVPAFAARDGIEVVGFDELWYTQGTEQGGGTMAKMSEGVGTGAAAEGTDVRAAHEGTMRQEEPTTPPMTQRHPADLQPDFGG